MNFGSSDPKIYGAMQRGGTIEQWHREDWYMILGGVARQKGWAWDASTMKLTNPMPSMAHAETPWCHAKHAPRKRCGLDHHVLFDGFGIIHPRCLECWKVVASPTNFDELIQVEKLQRTLDVPCKAGIELRDYTPRHYGSYYYTHSVEEGRERYKQVRELMDEINPEIDVILKRSCTEFEMVTGPSVFWSITDKELEFTEYVDHFVAVPENDNNQPDLMKKHVRNMWVLWAHANGDMSYKKYNGDKSLFPKVVTYHKGDLADINHDLLIGKASGKHKADPVKAEEFVAIALDWAGENNVDPMSLTTMLGVDEPNPINLQASMIARIPDDLKGEGDELS